jgi:hypothetical protein
MNTGADEASELGVPLIYVTPEEDKESYHGPDHRSPEPSGRYSALSPGE